MNSVSKETSISMSCADAIPLVIWCKKSSIFFRSSGRLVLTSPFRIVSPGRTFLCPLEINSVTETTAPDPEAILLEIIVWRAWTTSAPIVIASRPNCGIEECPPIPLIFISKRLSEEQIIPDRVNSSPVGTPGRLCMP